MSDDDRMRTAYQQTQDELLRALGEVSRQSHLLRHYSPPCPWIDSADLLALEWQAEMFARHILASMPLDMALANGGFDNLATVADSPRVAP